MFAEQPQGSVLITAGFGLPCSSAFLQDLVHLLRRFRLSFDADDVKLSLRNIDLDQVTFRYQSDGTARLRLRAAVADHRASRSSGKNVRL